MTVTNHWTINKKVNNKKMCNLSDFRKEKKETLEKWKKLESNYYHISNYLKN